MADKATVAAFHRWRMVNHPNELTPGKESAHYDEWSESRNAPSFQDFKAIRDRLSQEKQLEAETGLKRGTGGK